MSVGGNLSSAATRLNSVVMTWISSLMALCIIVAMITEQIPLSIRGNIGKPTIRFL